MIEVLRQETDVNNRSYARNDRSDSRRNGNE